MNALLKICAVGALISFLGSLPLGTMNVVATQLSVGAGRLPALTFTFGAVLIEVLYVSLSLGVMDKILKRPVVYRFFEWLSVFIILTLAFACLLSARENGTVSATLPTSFTDTFILGLLLSATSPLHITFWFGWSTVLIDKGLLIPSRKNYQSYLIGIALGSILGYLLFIEGGAYLVNILRDNQQWLNLAVGIILLLTGLIQAFKIIRKNHTTGIPHET